MHFRFARPHPKRTSVKANRHEDIADRLRRLGCTEEQITRHLRKEAVSPKGSKATPLRDAESLAALVDG